MPRKGEVSKRIVEADPKFVNIHLELRRSITKLINIVMREGKRSVAEKIVYGAFEQASKRLKEEPVQVFEKALNNVKPKLEVKSRRVGGATYQVPIDVKADRAQTLGMRWLVQAARARGEKTMQERLAGELSDAVSNRGSAVKKKDDTHRMAEANKAFSHYRW